MKAVFDTNILIDWTRKIPGSFEAIQNADQRYLSRVSWAEFLVGVPHSQRGLIEKFLEEYFVVLDTNEEIASHAIQLRQNIKKISMTDALIYGTAKFLKTILITRDIKDFDEGAEDIYVPYKLKEQ
jgi:predicted nucleic acid-binding protein